MHVCVCTVCEHACVCVYTCACVHTLSRGQDLRCPGATGLSSESEEARTGGSLKSSLLQKPDPGRSAFRAQGRPVCPGRRKCKFTGNSAPGSLHRPSDTITETCFKEGPVGRAGPASRGAEPQGGREATLPCSGSPKAHHPLSPGAGVAAQCAGSRVHGAGLRGPRGPGLSHGLGLVGPDLGRSSAQT